jgi:c-di-GMP-binding flagellar brake protein YcgR
MLVVPVQPPVHADAATLISQRSSPRVRMAETAAYLSNERILIARAADISLTGAFVQTHLPDPVGTRAALRLERGGEHIVAEVEVVRVSFCSQPDGTGAGMGLRFIELSRGHRKFLASYVANAQRNEDIPGALPFSIEVNLSDD